MHKVQSGMAREGVVQVETPTDVRVYIDQRCPQTVEWFEKMFCVQGREGLGVKVDVGGELELHARFASLLIGCCSGEESIIFASYPSIPPSSSPSTFKPPLTLLLGRPSQLATRKPRPDDPMPRGASPPPSPPPALTLVRQKTSLPTSSVERIPSQLSLSASPHPSQHAHPPRNLSPDQNPAPRNPSSASSTAAPPLSTAVPPSQKGRRRHLLQ